MKDVIEQTIYLPAGPERVWKALTTKDGLQAWFPEQGVEGTIAEGEDVVFCFSPSQSGDMDGRCRARIESMKPHKHFPYRWLPGTCSVAPLDTVPTTLVEFFLEPQGGGTRVTLKESGFASLPDSIRDQATKDNTEGWDEVLRSLAKYGETWNKQLTSV